MKEHEGCQPLAFAREEAARRTVTLLRRARVVRSVGAVLVTTAFFLFAIAAFSEREIIHGVIIAPFAADAFGKAVYLFTAWRIRAAHRHVA